MNIIHTADWHLGRILHSESLLDEQVFILDKLLDYIDEYAVDALLVAGDIYDRAIPPASAVALLDDFIDQLTQRGVVMVMISGNHDSATRLRFAAKQMAVAGVHIMGNLKNITTPTVLKKDGVTVNVFGIPYGDPESVRDAFVKDERADEINAIRGFDEAHTFLIDEIKAVYDTDQNNILMSHCFVDGAKVSESEKTLSVGGSDRVSFEPMMAFDYVALGHLHSPQSKGADTIRYSGSILKYSFSEHEQKKGVTLVKFDKKGLVSQSHLTLTPNKEVRVLTGELEDLIDQGRGDPHYDDYLKMVLTDTTALLDPLSRLRQVYPNTLHIEKVMLNQSSNQRANRDVLKRGESDMIHDFFSQITGNDMTAPQLKLISNALKNINKAED